ncbi:unnamed protein product [Rhizoctonia solani]|uniref:Chitin-binding type-2 domain-containing protein n=1 Tax=Rhizoctonia solani TaxID=456999 RepID=A0A8H3BEV3_9AGAM|nr:unnamed protein product [Rhizoctonia solani]
MLGLKVSVVLAASAYTAMATPTTVANILPRGRPSKSGKCRPNEFFFEAKSLCLPNIGGNPPHNFDCPRNWHWGPDDYCIPLFKEAAEEKVCGPGQLWNEFKLYCKAEKPTPAGDGCKGVPDKFIFESICLPLGGINTIEDPPENIACPRTKYWYKARCVPFFPSDAGNKKCPQGYKWEERKSYCAAAA